MKLLSEVLVEHKWRDPETVVHMSSDDQRNTVIVEIAGRTAYSGSELQGKSDQELVNIAVGLPI